MRTIGTARRIDQLGRVVVPAELRRMLDHVGGDLRKLFNTAGQDYRALDMKSRLPKMSVDEELKLLAGNGNLVKRPFALARTKGAVGFREEEWESLLR